jgi:long-chain acyl-CoA synthetase
MTTSAIVAAVRHAAILHPEKLAIVGADTRITYARLEKRAAAAAQCIAAQVKSNRVGLLCPNSLQFVEIFLGALWAGKTVSVLPTLAPAPLLKLMSVESRLEAVIAPPELRPRLEEVGVPVLACETGEADPAQVKTAERGEEAAVILYTSGTTGRPKSVLLSEQNILSNAEGCRIATGFNDQQVMLAILPLFHAYGLTVTILLPLVTGATVVIPERFIPRSVLQLIEKEKVSCLVAVPSQYRVLAKEPADFDASSLWLCIAGAERLPEHVAQDFQQRFGHPVVQGYGATEISPVVSLNLPETNRFGSVGKPLPGLRVTIRDDNGALLPATQVGEVCVEGPGVMLGYNDPQATARKIRNGVLHTGDKGFFDADGYLHLVGRADDLVKVSGEKVYPAEIETALEEVPGVDEAAVIAIPDEKHGARLHAFVQLKPGTAMNDAELRTAVRGSLEPYKIPRSFAIIEALPRTPTGKTDKKALAASSM